MSPREVLTLLSELEAIDVGEKHAAAIGFAIEMINLLDEDGGHSRCLDELLIDLDNGEIYY